MAVLRLLWAFLTSRWLWSLIGLVLIGAIVWIFGPLVAIGTVRPLVGEIARVLVILGIFVVWLASIVLARRRAMRANRLFVAELAVPEVAPHDPAADAVAAVGSKFQEIMAELRRRKLGGRRLLREMPWYVIIGPPASGKTTALRQSGLEFPFDLTDDLQGVGGTRNCDWFFTEDAVLIDTAGRYVQQESHPEVDAAEWLGFLDLLKKHRGRKALNGVIVALSSEILAAGDATIRAHGREIRKRLAELNTRLEIRLPVYLLVTKCDLVKGFEPSFEGLTASEREQVWGATFAPGEKADGAAISRELAALVQSLEGRVASRMEGEEALATRAEIFRFPAQVASLDAPLRTLVDTVFGESRYEESAWLRGFYLTSATQEGTPVDRLVGSLSSTFGLPVAHSHAAPRVERRSFFLRRFLTDVVFAEAGLASLDPAAEQRRLWLWRGGAVAAAAVFVLATLAFTVSYLSNRGAVAAQADEFERLRTALAPAAARQAPLEPSDLAVAVGAVTEIDNARVALPGAFARLVGPSAAAQLEGAQEAAYAGGLRNLLEPRMVALLEATMWRQIRDPEYLLDALKTYRMMTGLSQIDPDFATAWWAERLPEFAETNPFPTEAAFTYQLDAIDRMPYDASFVPPDDALVAAALRSVCSIPLAKRAYDALKSDPAAAALAEWIPAAAAGPNAAKVLDRRSEKTLRVGIDGFYTYEGFHGVVLERLEAVAAQAALDRSVFAGGCPESSDVSVTELADDMLKLYYEDFIAQWDGFLHDVTLAPLTDLPTATDNLKDLASADSALKRLITSIATETDLARPDEGGATAASPPKGLAKILGKLGKLGKLAKKGVKFIPPSEGGAPVDTSGQEVSDHFAPIRAAIAEVDGQPPTLDPVVAALGALANVLQTVSASPDPEIAIKNQGGLAELTGAVAEQAKVLPDPLDDWIAGLASDTTAITEQAVVKKLNAIWQSDVLPFCKAALTGRYPFTPDGVNDVNTADFQRLFGPGGLIDSFTNDHLLPYVDTTAEPWRWRADLGLDDGALAALERARRIRDALFPGGAGPVMTFNLTPTDLSPNASAVMLNLDGQTLTYLNSAARGAAMTWPGKDGTGVITLAFRPVEPRPEVMTSESGSWAWLRMLRGGNLTPTGEPDLFHLRLATGGYYADFDLQASSVDNPFDLQMFSRFKCPDRI